jgi:ABC-2 type transport system permease protein
MAWRVTSRAQKQEAVMSDTQVYAPGTRRFGRINWLGLYTLALREVMRFANVWTQTLLAPLVTAGLFMVIFTIAIGPRRGDVMGVGFTEFIAPGILMMTVIQNAFANTSSSIVIAKVQGNIVDTLMPPLSAGEMVVGYLAGGIVRGLAVAIAIALAFWLALGIVPAHPLVMLVFVTLGATFLSALGMVAGIFAQKFDQMAAITNFVITPLAFLSGTFYSAEALPDGLYQITHLNPVFYLIDGVRWGMLGVSDSAPLLGFAVVALSTMAICGLAWWFFRTGYRLKS